LTSKSKFNDVDFENINNVYVFCTIENLLTPNELQKEYYVVIIMIRGWKLSNWKMISKRTLLDYWFSCTQVVDLSQMSKIIINNIL